MWGVVYLGVHAHALCFFCMWVLINMSCMNPKEVCDLMCVCLRMWGFGICVFCVAQRRGVHRGLCLCVYCEMRVGPVFVRVNLRVSLWVYTLA